MPLTPQDADIGAPGDRPSAGAAVPKREADFLRVNRARQTLTSCSRLLIQAESETELLNVVCRIIVVSGGYRMAWVGFAENDAAKTVRPMAHSGYEDGYVQRTAISWAEGPQGSGPTGTAIRKGHAVVCRDILLDPSFSPWRDGAVERGYLSSVAVPIQSRGATLGAISIYSAERDGFAMEEVKLLQELAHDLGYAITVLRAREEHLREFEALRNKEALFNKLISTIPDRIYFKDRQSRFVQINDSMARRFGLKHPSEAVGKTDFDMFTEQHARQAYEDEQAIMTTGEPLISQDEKETWADGRTTWASTTKVPLRDAEGRINGLVGISRDVTERKKLEGQFLQSQKMEAFGQLAGGVAHDFNNILAAMLLQVSFIRLSSSLPDSVAAQMDELEQLTVRAAGVTRQLLMFSRRQDMEMKSLDLNAAIEGTCSLLKRLIGEHVVLELKTSREPLWIEADAGMVEQVVMNLCLNARDAMPDGGRLSIETFAEEGGAEAARACLVVADTGCGMDAATQARIFEPFFTTKPVGKGTGLGLATVYGILEQHRGWVDVESAPGRGSTFRAYFPIVRHSPRASSEADSRDLRGGSESVLLVEDDEMVRLALAGCLRRAGYRVVEAANGPEAVRAWAERKHEFDVLLTDFLMPGGINGAQLAERLLRERGSLRVIVISGYAALPDGAAIPWPKETVRLAKPFEMKTLLDTVRRSLDTRAGADLSTGI